MKISAKIDSKLNQHKIVVQTNDIEKSINIVPKPSGYGSCVNGAELLLLSLATCFCNDIYREAAKKGIDVTGVEVTFDGEFGADGETGFNFTYQANVQSEASPELIKELIAHTDKIAEIHNTLRKGLTITLKD